ncbi:unnamed protein product, partial [Allacma fusca]
GALDKAGQAAEAARQAIAAGAKAQAVNALQGLNSAVSTAQQAAAGLGAGIQAGLNGAKTVAGNLLA